MTRAPQAVLGGEGAQYELLLGDAVQVMATMPDGCVDAIITDLPYGNMTPYATYQDTPSNLDALIAGLMSHALRIAKRVVIFTGVPNMWRYPASDWVLCWFIPAGEGSTSWGFNCWQPVLVYGKDPYLASGQGRRPDSWKWDRVVQDKSGHPCPKPVEVMRWFVRRTTLPGETVLDPFMGSGTTGVACRMEGRSFVGIEIDPTYHVIAERRVMQAQMPLILEPIV